MNIHKIRYRSLFFLIQIICSSNYAVDNHPFDVSIVGSMAHADGLARLSISLMHTLSESDITMNFIPTRYTVLDDLHQNIIKIATDPDKTAGNVAILFDTLWDAYWPQGSCAVDKMPNSKIKIAYSMMQTTAIPLRWVEILNTTFDAVVVPDTWLLEVYKNSGVTIPIFNLPIPLFLDELLVRPVKKKQLKEEFVFGTSCGFISDHKNQELLIKAFAHQFKNNPKVKLRMHGSGSNSPLVPKFLKMIQDLGITNIEIINKTLCWSEYIDFLESLDCYVLLSKGEGFSITPREALALAIPCILSSNTGQQTICETGLVRSVTSDIKELADYSMFFGKDFCGYHFNCSLINAADALQDMYSNFDQYAPKALKAREWVKQYTPENLMQRYMSLLKPRKILLGSDNSITDSYLMTDNERLYAKYLALQGSYKPNLER